MIEEHLSSPVPAFQFRGDKNVEDSPLTNQQRADNGLACVSQVFDYSDNDLETGVVDALANIFHLCDSKQLDVEDILRTARMHWQEER